MQQAGVNCYGHGRRRKEDNICMKALDIAVSEKRKTEGGKTI